jgi:hypothetical protein
LLVGVLVTAGIAFLVKSIRRILWGD